MIPTSTTVHSVFIKKLSYPLSSRPDELWIVERALDGIETWKPVETFLENMHLTSDRATLRTTANHWRQYYDVPIQSSSSSTATSVPVLPHPEHTNVYVSQPYESDPGPASHFTIMLGTFGSTPFTRYHYFFILATMEIYTTFFTIGNISPDLTFQSPYRTCSPYTLSTGCERPWPDGYV